MAGILDSQCPLSGKAHKYDYSCKRLSSDPSKTFFGGLEGVDSVSFSHKIVA